MITIENFGISKSSNIINIANLAPSYLFESESLSTAVKTMISSEHRHLPIVSEKQEIAGILTHMDILNALLRGLSRNVPVSSFMTKHVVFCEPSASMGDVLRKMQTSRKDSLPLVKDSRLLGVVSEYDFVKLIYGKYVDTTIGERMSHKPLSIKHNTPVRDCIKTMVNTHYRRLPVVDGKNLVGILTAHDVLVHLSERGYSQTSLNDGVDGVMSTPVVYAGEHDDISYAVKLMIEHKIGGLPVIDEKNFPVGIITERDIVELL